MQFQLTGPNLTKIDNLKYNAITKKIITEWGSLVARHAHNLKVLGSNPSPATNLMNEKYYKISLETILI